jgi:L,D-transpeptidase catalytic domain
VLTPEQIAAALERLDPADREVLHLSLRRRVPDADLAEVMGGEPGDVPRRRAAAIDRLAEDLGVQRGEDLGHMLKALLDPDAWDVAKQPEEEQEEPPPPEDEGTPHVDVPEVAPEPVRTGPASEPDAAPAAVAAPPGNGTGADQPVLEMLSRPEPKDDRGRDRGAAGTAAWILAGTLGAAALIAAAGFAGATLFGDDDSSSTAERPSPTRHFTAKDADGPLAAPFPSERAAAPGYLTAAVKRPTVLYDRPGGRRKLRLQARTEWKSPRVLSVIRQRGAWLGVLAPELRNGQIGWIRRSGAELGSVTWSLHVDRSKRTLSVRKDGRTLRRLTIAIGNPRNPTPAGRFAVTDKLSVVDKDSPYGCCVLALTGHQVKLPPDWPGGDRLAIHATVDTSSIGKAVSLGCMRASTQNARWLMRQVPLGAPIFIRS